MEIGLIHIALSRPVFDDISVMILQCLSGYEFRETAEFVFGDAYREVAFDLLVGVEDEDEVLVIVIDVGCAELVVFA